jgi:hypothetical protein
MMRTAIGEDGCAFIEKAIASVVGYEVVGAPFAPHISSIIRIEGLIVPVGVI